MVRVSLLAWKMQAAAAFEPRELVGVAVGVLNNLASTNGNGTVATDIPEVGWSVCPMRL